MQNLFKKSLKQEFDNNIADYKTLQKAISLKNSIDNKSKNAKMGSSVADELAALLVSEELQVFYPYEDTNVKDYYVSFDPLNESKTNFGYKFEGGSTDVEVVNGLDNNFLDDNPVYLIVPIDPCDIPGRPCDFIELKPVDEESTNKLAASTNLSQGKYRLDYKTNKVSNGFPAPVTTLLTYNVNHNNIPETDIISSYIPKIKIHGTAYMGFGGTHQKLRFFRGSADGKVTQNADGTITAAPSSHQIADYRFKRKYIATDKHRRWLDMNAEYDPEWNMSENTQVMAVFSIHHLKATASAEFEVKSGFKLEKGVPVPFAEATDTRKLKISTGSAIFRANAEMSRRQILATIVGPGPIGSTVADNGVQYNVKKIGIIEYYFKHIYTDL